MACKGRHFGPDAVLEPFVPEIRAPRPNCDTDVYRIIRRVETQLTETDKCQRTDVTLLELVGANQLESRVIELLLRVRQQKTEDLSRIGKPAHMFF